MMAIFSPQLPRLFTKLSLPEMKMLPMSRKTGCYQQEQFNLHWENSVSDGSQCVINNRRFKMQGPWESKNCNSLTRQNNNFARVSSITLFCTFLCCHCTTTTWKCLISRFVKNVSKQWQNFLLFVNFDMVDRNTAPEEFTCIWQSKRVGIITIETKEMWIHLSSSSLYFWKSVFSFWVDSISKWRVYIKLKVSWLPAFLWCMSQKSRDRVSSCCVQTHEKNWGDAVHRLGTIIQSIFCAQSGASTRLTIWKWSGESQYPGALPPVLAQAAQTHVAREGCT